MLNLNALKEPTGVVYEGRPCVIGSALNELPPEYKELLLEQLTSKWADGGYTDFEIAARMRNAGLKASPSSVGRHRSGKCSCPTKESK